MTIAAFFTLLAFWIVVNVLMISEYDSLDMMLNSFQNGQCMNKHVVGRSGT